MTTIRLLSEADLMQLKLTHDDFLEGVEIAYRQAAAGLAEVPTKIGVHPDHPNSFSHAMPAWIGGEKPALGIKWISYHPGNLAHQIPDSWGVIVVNDPETGKPLCFMEGMYLTFLRTAACGAVLARRLIDSPKVLGLIGCGGLGKASLIILRHVFPSLEKVYVSSRRSETRAKFAETYSTESCPVEPVDDIEQLLAQADVVVTSLPPVDTPPIKAGMLKENSVFIPLDLDFSWDASVAKEFDGFYADNVPHFQSLLDKKTAGSSETLAPVYDSQSFVAQPVDDGVTAGRSLVAVCGIASVDIVLASEAYHRAVQADIGIVFPFRQP